MCCILTKYQHLNYYCDALNKMSSYGFISHKIPHTHKHRTHSYTHSQATYTHRHIIHTIRYVYVDMFAGPIVCPCKHWATVTWRECCSHHMHDSMSSAMSLAVREVICHMFKWISYAKRLLFRLCTRPNLNRSASHCTSWLHAEIVCEDSSHCDLCRRIGFDGWKRRLRWETDHSRRQRYKVWLPWST